MKSLRELTRRMDALEGKQGERLVIVLKTRPWRDDSDVIAIAAGDGDGHERWERRPGESLEQLNARASAEVGGGAFGIFVVLERLAPNWRTGDKWGQLDGTH